MTLPIALPLVVLAGWDPVWFGVYIILVIEMAQVTPPVGFNLFVIQGLTGEPMLKIARYAFPFFLIMCLATVLLTVFPEIVLFLPQYMVVK
jgi:TRAP-type C4-dicarboxylate transport system permease large subunit